MRTAIVPCYATGLIVLAAFFACSSKDGDGTGSDVPDFTGSSPTPGAPRTRRRQPNARRFDAGSPTRGRAHPRRQAVTPQAGRRAALGAKKPT